MTASKNVTNALRKLSNNYSIEDHADTDVTEAAFLLWAAKLSHKDYETVMYVMDADVNYSTSAATSDPGEPKTFKEAMNCPESDKWREGMKGEYNNFTSR